MAENGQNFYNLSAINKDVNPFMAKTSELTYVKNFYSRIYGAKKVRFGYGKLLDNPDESAVKSLIPYDLGDKKGLLRYSDKKLYNADMSDGQDWLTTTSWGSMIKEFSEDSPLPYATLMGTSLFLHIGNKTDGYYTWDGTTFKRQRGTYVPSPTALASWNSRIFADVNELTLAQSAISFDLNGYSVTGTASVVNGDATVTGANTLFNADLTTITSLLIEGVSYRIASITDNTHLELDIPYAGASASGLTLKTSYSADPFFLNSNDPAGGGTSPMTAGRDGKIIKITSSSDRINIYKQYGVYRYNGQSFFRMPFTGHILDVCTSKDDIDYIFTSQGIYKNNGSSIEPADMGINTIILDTFRDIGVQLPKSVSVGNYTVFYVGTIKVGRDTIQNAAFVHHERWDIWDIWEMGHAMTCFGYYDDPNTNERIMVSGDANGNTYKWGEEYSSDDGEPINYDMRTHYNVFEDPYRDKIADRYSLAVDNWNGATIQFATDFKDDYYGKEQGASVGYLTKDYFNEKIRTFQALAIRVFGSTTSNRPEVHGYSVGFKDVNDRPVEVNNQRTR